MTIIQKNYARNVIRRVAKQHGISTKQCRSEMAAMIAQTWATQDQQTKQRQVQLVGDTHIPSPEELIVLLTDIDK